MSSNPKLQTAISQLADKSAGEAERVDACHSLAKISGQESINALVTALSDSDIGVRWAAADALRHHGPSGIEAVLSELVTQPADSRLYESAHHALSGSGDPIIKPVLKALDDKISSDTETPLAAYKALGDWREKYP